MSDVNNNKSFGSGLTAINEVSKHIDYIFEDIFVFLYRNWYDIVVYDVELSYPVKFTYPGHFPYYGKFPYPGFLYEFLHMFIPGLPYPGNIPYPGKYLYRVIFLYPVKPSIFKSYW